MRNISSRGFNPGKDIETTLFNHTLKALNNAVTSTFGEVNDTGYDADFVNTLKYNNAVFSAFKTHCQQNEIHSQMFDEDGTVRSFAQFRKATEGIIHNYNTNWLQTEYNTAIIRAQFAQKWKEMEQDRDIYPNVQWLPSTSVNPRETHMSLYYMVFAFDDPFLQSNYPGSLWNCKCSAKATNIPVSSGSSVKTVVKTTLKPQLGLDENPGVTGRIFTTTHPYIANCKKNEAKEILFACEKLMSDTSRRNVRDYFKTSGKATQILKVKDGPVEQVIVSYQDIKNITGKPHKYNYHKNNACYRLSEILQTAEYIGSSPDIKPNNPHHEGLLNWYYYSFELNREASYITIKENDKNEMRIHSIQDAKHFKLTKIRKP